RRRGAAPFATRAKLGMAMLNAASTAPMGGGGAEARPDLRLALLAQDPVRLRGGGVERVLRRFLSEPCRLDLLLKHGLDLLCSGDDRLGPARLQRIDKWLHERVAEQRRVRLLVRHASRDRVQRRGEIFAHRRAASGLRAVQPCEELPCLLALLSALVYAPQPVVLERRALCAAVRWDRGDADIVGKRLLYRRSSSVRHDGHCD